MTSAWRSSGSASMLSGTPHGSGLARPATDVMVEKVASRPPIRHWRARRVARWWRASSRRTASRSSPRHTAPPMRCSDARRQGPGLITQASGSVQGIHNQASAAIFQLLPAKPAPDRAAEPDPRIPEAPIPSHVRGAALIATPGAVPPALAAPARFESRSAYLFAFMNPALSRNPFAHCRGCPNIHGSLRARCCRAFANGRAWPTTLVNAYLEPVLVRYIDHLIPPRSGRRTPPCSAF